MGTEEGCNTAVDGGVAGERKRKVRLTKKMMF